MERIYKEIIMEVTSARDALRKAEANSKCTCSGFILQYEGSCQCDAGDRITEARNVFWSVIDNL